MDVRFTEVRCVHVCCTEVCCDDVRCKEVRCGDVRCTEVCCVDVRCTEVRCKENWKFSEIIYHISSDITIKTLCRILHLFTFVYICSHLFTFVYICLHLFTFVNICSHLVIFGYIALEYRLCTSSLKFRLSVIACSHFIVFWNSLMQKQSKLLFTVEKISSLGECTAIYETK